MDTCDEQGENRVCSFADYLRHWTTNSILDVAETPVAI